MHNSHCIFRDSFAREAVVRQYQCCLGWVSTKQLFSVLGSGKPGHFLAPDVPCFPAAPLAPGESKRPLVIFSHGLGGNRGVYSVLAAEMASYVSAVAWRMTIVRHERQLR